MTALREPLDPSQVAIPEGWRIEAVAETGSTNGDLLAAAEAGAAAGLMRVAEFQNSGRGRLDRSWSSPPGAGLTVSLLLRPAAPVLTWGWLPLLTGLALVEAIGGDARLKWPNDLLLGPDGRKAAGILVQTTGEAAVVGIGLNVTTERDELPVPTATSLALEAIRELDRAAILGNLLASFEVRYRDWQAAEGDAEASGLAAAYRGACATIGSEVTVERPAEAIRGDAVGVDGDGRLLVRPTDGTAEVAIAAGDVTHVRAISR
jgi:BirA family biotin operon repressor/biotin-[acetyl-CoA-carboxylase] ligase